jgi:hypothetical protein
MKRIVLMSMAAGLALALGSPGFSQEGDDAAFQRSLLDAQAGSVVTVKFVMKLHFQRGVQEGDREINQETPGVLVSADGLVVISNLLVSPHSESPNIQLTGNPVDFKVLFPGDDDEKEYDAVLAAKDSNLQLAFVALKDPKAHALAPVDFEKAAPAEVGQTLYGVTRLSREFDFAPVIGRSDVLASVVKPRKMHLAAGPVTVPGMVLYGRSGAPAGILSVQEGASQRETRVFLLPPDVVKAAIKQATESAKEVLAESAAAEKKPDEGGAEKKPEEGGTEPPKEGDTPPKDEGGGDR